MGDNRAFFGRRREVLLPSGVARHLIEDHAEPLKEGSQSIEKFFELTASRVGKLEIGRHEEAAELVDGSYRREEELDAREGTSPHSILPEERRANPAHATLGLEELGLSGELDAEL